MEVTAVGVGLEVTQSSSASLTLAGSQENQHQGLAHSLYHPLPQAARHQLGRELFTGHQFLPLGASEHRCCS